MSAASALLAIPEVRNRVSPVTVAQYQQLPEFNQSRRRTELIRGLIIEKMSKSPLHCSIARRLFSILLPQIPSHFLLLREDPLILHDSAPEPDLAVVRGDESDFILHHPTTAALVIEIAVSSPAEDRSLVALYAEADVEEYWIILPAERQVEVYRGKEGGAYREAALVEGNGVLDCRSIAGLRVALAELFPEGK